MKRSSLLLVGAILVVVVTVTGYWTFGRRPTEVRGALGAYPKGWTQEALGREADYIVDCSYTQDAANHAGVQPSAAAYGAINDVRIAQAGPDWVMPGEAAVAGIGLMAGAEQLKNSGQDIRRYDRMLNAFFQMWLLHKRQPIEINSADAGGIVSRVYYDGAGQFQRREPANASATGMIVAACWKFYEYDRAVGKPQEADRWLQEAWPMARDAGDFLQRCFQSRYGLVQANTDAPDLWVSDSVAAVCGLRCLSRWAAAAHQTPSFDYDALASQIVAGIQQMRDAGTTPGFFKFRNAGRLFEPVYGDSLDQLGFLPYEADALDPGEPFARRISDWWTLGGGGVRMTYQTDDPNDWRYYGMHWHHHFTPAPDDSYLYPGPDLQLAKVEWKAGHKTGDAALLARARHRFDWASQTRYSGLWLGATGASEAGVANGLLDWRDANDRAHTAASWMRFVDTSAYFIEVNLMVNYGRDTTYVPD